MRKKIFLAVAALVLLNPVSAKVMGQNTDQLPPGCSEISGTASITVKAGTEHAEKFPSKMYTYSDRKLQFPPCTKLNVTFVNNDSIRHQWMVHGLPGSIYPEEMFMLEVTGPGKDTGTFILPDQDESLLIHCGVPQHMQKGMKAQLTVGDGDGSISNIPGHTAAVSEYQYGSESAVPLGMVLAILMAFGGSAAIILVERKTED